MSGLQGAGGRSAGPPGHDEHLRNNRGMAHTCGRAAGPDMNVRATGGVSLYPGLGSLFWGGVRAGANEAPEAFAHGSPPRSWGIRAKAYETTAAGLRCADAMTSFNPRPPEGGDVDLAYNGGLTRFNPRPPGGRRPYLVRTAGNPLSCFNPRPPGGRRRCAQASGRRRAHCGFNPRPPGGRRPEGPKTWTEQSGFQSTPPRREAT